MGSINFAYVGVLCGILGLIIGSLLGPGGALFGFITGMIVGALFWRNRTNSSQKVTELEERINTMEKEEKKNGGNQ